MRLKTYDIFARNTKKTVLWAKYIQVNCYHFTVVDYIKGAPFDHQYKK